MSSTSQTQVSCQHAWILFKCWTNCSNPIISNLVCEKVQWNLHQPPKRLALKNHLNWAHEDFQFLDIWQWPLDHQSHFLKTTKNVQQKMWKSCMDTYRTLKMKGLKAGVYFQSISKCVCTTRTNHVILFTMKDTENEQTSKEKTVEQTVEIDIAERSADGKCLPKHQSTFIVNSFICSNNLVQEHQHWPTLNKLFKTNFPPILLLFILWQMISRFSFWSCCCSRSLRTSAPISALVGSFTKRSGWDDWMKPSVEFLFHCVTEGALIIQSEEKLNTRFKHVWGWKPATCLCWSSPTILILVQSSWVLRVWFDWAIPFFFLFSPVNALCLSSSSSSSCSSMASRHSDTAKASFTRTSARFLWMLPLMRTFFVHPASASQLLSSLSESGHRNITRISSGVRRKSTP